MELDSVQVGAGDVAAAVAAYRLLLGVEPVPLPGGAWRFPLARGAIEVEAGAPCARSVRFVGAADVGPDRYHGLPVTVAAAPASAAPPDAGISIDHVVVQTPDPERAIALWRDRLGLRLAFDRAFAERGLRLLFFRSNGMTLEFAAPHPPLAERDGPDRLYGVSYRVTDLEARRARLVAAGVDVSAIRPGHKAGTVVASVRSGTAGVPTLLLQNVDG